MEMSRYERVVSLVVYKLSASLKIRSHLNKILKATTYHENYLFECDFVG